MTLLVTGHNIGHLVKQKLENLSNIEYQGELIIHFVLDGCKDDSKDRLYAEKTNYKFPLELTDLSERNGKEAAIREALISISSDVLVFSDSDAMLQSNAVQLLVVKLMQPGVGAVSGRELHNKEDDADASEGQSLFYKFEEFLKIQQDKISSLCYVQGGNFAMWRTLYPKSIPAGATQDGIIAFDIVLANKRIAYQKLAVSKESYNLSNKEDYSRRIRTVSRAFYSVISRPNVINPFRTGWFGFHLMSARVLRWFLLPLIVVGLITGIIYGKLWYQIALISAVLIWSAMTLFGWWGERIGKRYRFSYFIYYFSYIHFAAAIAVVRVIFGKREIIWKPSS